jgi:4'-phosphopantetheinyl transferase
MAGRRRAAPRSAARELPPASVQVHCVRVPRDGRALDAALGLLTPEERAWARRLGQAQARARFIIARAALRALLGAWLGRAPSRIRFDVGPHGKPALRARAGDAPLHFSVSHSGSLALLAISADGPVGVDVERERDLPNALPLAERFFSPAERREVRAERPAERSRLFLSLWTAKEAVLKARGDGLAGLERVELTRRGAPPGELLGVEDGAVRWSVRPLAPGRGYVAAVAAPAPEGRLAVGQTPGPRSA